MTKTRVPAVAGLFTMDPEPRLIAGRARGRASVFFPKDLAGSDPGSVGDPEREEVLLGNRGTVWSFTTMEYAPPAPYPQEDPFRPFILAAVQVEPEKIVVLGQMVRDTGLADMHVGMEVELVVDTLYEDDDNEYVVWKWQGVTA